MVWMIKRKLCPPSVWLLLNLSFLCIVEDAMLEEQRDSVSRQLVPVLPPAPRPYRLRGTIFFSLAICEVLSFLSFSFDSFLLTIMASKLCFSTIYMEIL